MNAVPREVEPLLCALAPVEAIARLAGHVPVFPCRRSAEELVVRGERRLMKPKSPLTLHGFREATQDPQQIRAWWQRWPEALVGIPTGSITGLIVIDFDAQKADEAANDWIREHADALLATRSHQTLSGGRHYLFRTPDGAEYRNGVCIKLAGQERKGIDVRAEGGYIIWWPLHGARSTGEIAPLPAGLIDEQRIEKRDLPPLSPKSPAEWARDRQQVADALAYLDPSDRDMWTRAGLAIHLAAGGSDDGFNLWHAWSAGELNGECPPNYCGINDCRYNWASFRHDKDPSKLVTLGTVFEKARERGYVRPAAVKPERPPDESYVQDAEREAARQASPSRSRRARSPQKGALQYAVPDLKQAIGSLAFRGLRRICAAETNKRPWFFAETIPAGAFLIVGRPKIGKSWLLLQLAIAAATCRAFLGYEALGQFGVLYIASEDDDARMQSRTAQYHLGESVPDNLTVIVREEFERVAKQFSEHMTLVEFLRIYLADRPDIKLVILDTESTCRFVWAHAAAGIEREQSITRKDYAETREFDALALEPGIFVGLVNHTAKKKNGHWLDIHETINRTNTALAGASGSIVLADPPGKDPTETKERLRVLGIRGRDISGDFLLAIEQMEGSPLFVNHGAYHVHRQTRTEQEIMEALETLEGYAPEQWHTAKELAEEIGSKAGTVQRAITRMVRAGKQTWKEWRIETKPRKGIRFIPKFGAPAEAR